MMCSQNQTLKGSQMSNNSLRVSKIHKVEFHSSPFLSWRLADEEKYLRGLDMSPTLHDCQTVSQYDACEIVRDWAYAAKIAFGGERPESDLAVWEGHCEQFGRIMLELWLLSAKHEPTVQQWDYWKEGQTAMVKELDENPLYDAVYRGTECRNWYRAWFNYLQHPEFTLYEDHEGRFFKSYLILTTFTKLNDELKVRRLTQAA
jgi:hypothetical protein